MTDNKLKLFFLRFGLGLAEFFTLRDWVPQIPTPPKRRREGVMSLVDAIKGFPPTPKR